jgi:peroxiredoxin Q/BCP
MITLKQGDQAPAFTGIDQDGKQVSLTEFKGKKLILYFFSEAGSPTCTIESCNLRDNYGLLSKDGFEILGVSPDNGSAIKKFEVKYKLPFRIISDSSHEIMEKYGTWDQKKLFGREYMGVLRTTFIIDEKGIIRKIFLKPRNKVHGEEIIEAWKSLP